MARTPVPLNPTQIKNAKPGDTTKILSDGGGLQLRINPNGSKLWYFSYVRPTDKKRTVLALGKYPSVSLALARRMATSNAELVYQGIDPKLHKLEQDRQKSALQTNSVKNITLQWFEIKKPQVSVKQAHDILRSFEMYIFPYVGSDPITSITAPKMIDILRPIDASGKAFVTGKVVQRFNEVMNFAVNIGAIHSNPTAGIKAAFKAPIKKNTPALAPEEITELIMTVESSGIRLTTKRLIMWQLNTMVRPGEAAGTRWDEFDFENNIWIIPKERMKGKKGKEREHRVPLTPQMIAILDFMRPISSRSEFVFPADRDPKKPANKETANTALKRLGFQGRTTAHGLRTLASTTLNDQGFDGDLIEASLAHVGKDQVRNAYNRTDYLERRRKLMSWWSEHVERSSYGNVSITGIKNLRIINNE